MERLKRCYYYFFYKIYKSIEYTSEIGGGKFWTDFKASIVLSVLEIWFVFSLFFFYKINFNQIFDLDKILYLITGGVIFIVNTVVFDYSNKWKEYNIEFEHLPKNKNIIGGIIVWAIIILITIGFWTSTYLVWKNSKGL